MRVKYIGSISFNNTTNIVVGPTNLDAVGGGFRVKELNGPQPFSVEVAFIRATRQLALRAFNILGRDLYLLTLRRSPGLLNVPGGVEVGVEDETGATMRAWMVDGSANLIAIEPTNTGVIARARVSGMLLGPFASSTAATQTFSSFRAYERRSVTLSTVDDFNIAHFSVEVSITGNTGLRNTLFAIEALEGPASTSRVFRKSPSSVSGNLVLENFDAGDTALQRARFTASGNGTITYNLANSEAPIDTFNLFFEVYLPSAPTTDVLYTISWAGQPAISGVVDFVRTFIKAGIYTRAYSATTVTIQITNAPAGTYVSPLVFIPVNGVYVFNATATNLASWGAFNPTTEALLSLSAVGTAGPGILRGPAGFIAGKYLTVFSGMMAPSIADLSASVALRPRIIQPASFM